jgi:hypothetical protein
LLQLRGDLISKRAVERKKLLTDERKMRRRLLKNAPFFWLIAVLLVDCCSFRQQHGSLYFKHFLLKLAFKQIGVAQEER